MRSTSPGKATYAVGDCKFATPARNDSVGCWLFSASVDKTTYPAVIGGSFADLRGSESFIGTPFSDIGKG